MPTRALRALLVASLGAVTVLAPAALARSAASPPGPASGVPLTDEQIVALLRPSTVHILASFAASFTTPAHLTAGTGIVYDTARGYILTNAHVVEGADSIVVGRARNTGGYPAQVVGVSPCDDLAILHVSTTLHMRAATLGDSDAVDPGAQVVALGYPFEARLGADVSVDAGIVSQTGVSLGKYQSLLKIDVPINPGNSGGPLVDLHGAVVGINTLGRVSAENTNYAIAMSYARPLLATLQRGGNLHDLGMTLEPNGAQYSDTFGTDQGLIVTSVISGTPAAQIGLQPTDLLLQLGGTNVATEDDVCSVLRAHRDGDPLAVKVKRIATGQTLEGTLAQQWGSPRARPLTVTGQPVTTPGIDATTLWILLDSAFAGDDPGPWPTGASSDGLWDASVAGGWYTVALTNTTTTLLPAASSAVPAVADGYILARARLAGAGQAGVVARRAAGGPDPDEYVCTIANDSTFGCQKVAQGVTTDIFPRQITSAIIPAGMNTVVLGVVGNTITFIINGVVVGQFTDGSPLPAGGWGLAAAIGQGSFSAAFNRVIIAEAQQ
jgi:S1-C subfamily serine protease